MKKALIIGNGMMGGSLGMALTNTGKYMVDFLDTNKELSSVSLDDDCSFDRIINMFFGGKNSYQECISSKYNYIINCTGQKLHRPDLEKCFTIYIDISSVQHKVDCENTIFCHPLCGSEKSGRENARCDLFQNQNCIITTEGKSQELIDCATEFFNEIKMNVFYCDTVEEHNKNIAYTSHLLHYLALNGLRQSQPVLERLSHSNKEMWEMIFKENKENIDKALLRLCDIAFNPSQFVASYSALTQDIPEHFYGNALKELKESN